jgi:hypothetical protein
MSTFALVLDHASSLPLEDQEQLAETLRRRVAEQRRAEITKAVKQSREEFDGGQLRAARVASIMKKVRA